MHMWSYVIYVFNPYVHIYSFIIIVNYVNNVIYMYSRIKKLIDTSSFVAVNLYAKSIFGEDALANISIEKLPDGKLTGSTAHSVL